MAGRAEAAGDAVADASCEVAGAGAALGAAEEPIGEAMGDEADAVGAAGAEGLWLRVVVPVGTPLLSTPTETI
jgi:hypothetical protein